MTHSSKSRPPKKKIEPYSIQKRPLPSEKHTPDLPIEKTKSKSQKSKTPQIYQNSPYQNSPIPKFKISAESNLTKPTQASLAKMFENRQKDHLSSDWSNSRRSSDFTKSARSLNTQEVKYARDETFFRLSQPDLR